MHANTASLPLNRTSCDRHYEPYGKSLNKFLNIPAIFGFFSSCLYIILFKKVKRATISYFTQKQILKVKKNEIRWWQRRIPESIFNVHLYIFFENRDLYYIAENALMYASILRENIKIEIGVDWRWSKTNCNIFCATNLFACVWKIL